MDKTSILIDWQGKEHEIDDCDNAIICLYYTKEEIEDLMKVTLTTIEWYQIRDMLNSQLCLTQNDIWDAGTLLREIREVPMKYRKQGQAKKNNT